MNIILLLLFVSLVLALGSVLMFGVAVKNRDLDRPDEISLLPLEEDDHGKKANHL